MRTLASFKNKQVAILGLSVEGQDSVKFFISCGAKVFCCDRRNQKELGVLYQELAKLPVTFRLGPHYLQGLASYDLLVRTPGMAAFLPEIAEVRKHGVEITSLTKIFFDICPCPIIGVTGTKGKGTTTTLVGEMLKTSGQIVYIGGNVGKALLSQVKSMSATGTVVLELSSFQLEDLNKSPHIAVVLNITSDHLANADPLATNYHRSRTEYIAAKKNILSHQISNDFAIINADYETSFSFAKLTSGQVYFFSKNRKVTGIYVDGDEIIMAVGSKSQTVCRIKDIRLRGKHNWENVLAASLAAYLGGASFRAIKNTIKIFKGLEHRLEEVATVDVVTYYNDSFSTTPETSIAAIQAFSEPIVLIAGGSEKGADFTELGREIVKRNVKTLILIGQMTQRINDAVQIALRTHPRNLKIITGLTSMHDVVLTSQKEARPKDVVLLSPACASFGMFKNYKERGNLFKQYVKTLT